MHSIDIAIVGGGPAGLQTAINLAKLGYTPHIFEEHKKIGLPIQCGEGISAQVLEEFEISPSQSRGFCVSDYVYTKIHFPPNYLVYGDTKAIMIKRDLFDQYLQHKLEDLGGIVHVDSKVHSVKHEDDTALLSVGTNRDEFNSKIVVLAEGPNANIAQTLGFSPPQPLIGGYEYKLEGIHAETLEFFFDTEKYPYGYAWIFPRDTHSNVGLVTIAKNRKSLLDSFIREKGIDSKRIRKVGGKIPMNGPVSSLHRQNILLVGDCAGLPNPVFYGGIRLGLISGKLAAESIHSALSSENKRMDLSLYTKKMKQMPFMKKMNLDCHKFFYSRDNHFLELIGSIFHEKYINRIENKELFSILRQLMSQPSLMKHPHGLYKLYKGFKLARDWGF